jgi:hypothetical protein
MDAILEGKCEEGMRLNLEGGDKLVLSYNPRLKSIDRPVLEARLQALSDLYQAVLALVRRCPNLRLGWCWEAE